jgi:hypothetical protein
MLRSGRRNMADISTGTITSKKDPSLYTSVQAYATDNSAHVVNAGANTFRDLWQQDCEECQPVGSRSAAAIPAGVINPYVYGIKGNWRPEHAYANHRERTAAPPNTGTDIRKEGVNKSFVRFWDYNNGWRINPTHDWIRQSTATIYDIKGNQLEEKDALNIYSTAKFGYKGNFNIAVAHNTRLRQGMSENFEDDRNFDLSPGCENDCRFTEDPRFQNGRGPTELFGAHTGRYAFQVTSDFAELIITELSSNTDSVILKPLVGGSYAPGFSSCIPAFRPTPGGDYLISAWVKGVSASTCPTVYPARIVVKTFDNSGGLLATSNCLPEGPIVDGWQRIFAKVNISSNADKLEVYLENTNSVQFNMVYDDFRFHPWLGNMKSFVYDPITQRLWATLDENNYATFYEYDDEGKLVRVKRETEKGIMTIEEHRSSIQY